MATTDGPNRTALALSGKNEGQGVPARSLPSDVPPWEAAQVYECSLVKVPGGYLVSRQNRPAGIFDSYGRARAYIKARWPNDSVWIDLTTGRIA